MTTTAIGASPRSPVQRVRTTTLVSAVSVVALWIIISLIAGHDASGQRMVPGPFDLVRGFDKFADYWPGGLGVEATALGGQVTTGAAVLGFIYNTGITLTHTILGVILGTLVAVGAAALISWSQHVRQAASLPAHVGRLLPLLAMTSLFALWFGDSHLGVVLFVAFTSFALVFPIALGSIGSVPAYYAQYARSLGASGLRTYLEVILPAGLPPIRSGVLLALGFGWSASIAAEYITAQYGLGHIVKNAEYFGLTGLLGLVGLIALVLAGVSLYVAERSFRWLTRWAE